MNSPTTFYGDMAYDPERQSWVVTQLKPHVAIRLKAIFPRIPIGKSSRLVIAASPDTAADLQWFMERYPLKASPEDRAVLKEAAKVYFDTQAAAEAIRMPDWKPKTRLGLRSGQKLRDYQKVFLDLCEEVQSLLCLDDIGLGKSYEGLAVGLIPGTLPMAVVVQPHLSKQWVAKAQEFINLRVCEITTIRPHDLPEADIYVFRYTQIAGWVDVLSSGYFKAVVYDEIQELRRGSESSKGTAAASIHDAVPYRVGLTATVVYNYGIEAFNICDVIRRGALGTRHDFVREWCTHDGTGKGVVQDPDALGAYLREINLVIRRRKCEVGQEAKQGKPHIEWVEPDTKAVKDSAELAESLAMTALTADFTNAGRAAREFDLRMREMTGIAKATQVAAYTRMFVETGTPVILWGWHREVYRIWLSALADLKPVMYTGSETTAQKERNKQAFINGETDLMIMSLRSGAGADGIQHRCSTGIFGELDWSPKIHEQCAGRLDRDGQEDTVFLFYAATQFGSDPTIIDLHGLKDSQGSGITDPGVDAPVYQADADRIKRLARDWLAARGKQVPKRQHEDAVLLEEEQMALL